MNQTNNQRPLGFTIIELMIAMAFISLLLLAIAGAVLQVGAIYNKGVTMKSVNQAGRIIVADMKRVVGESQPFDTTQAYRPQRKGSQIPAIYDGGRLCTGIYSYIWNIGKYIESPNSDPAVPTPQVNKYADNSDKQLRLVRVRDNGGQYCKDDATSDIQPLNATELLSDGNLAVQDFHIDRLTANMATGMALYSIRIVISDADRDAINSVDNNCKSPSEDSTYQNYCAVNEFIFTARAGNKGSQ